MKFRHAALLSSCAILSVHGKAQGQTTVSSTWVAPTPTTGTSLWSTPGNWTPSDVPNNGNGTSYDVTINSGLPTLSSTSIEVNSLGINSPGASALVLDQGGSLTVDQNLQDAGGLTLYNGSNLLVKGNVSASGDLSTGEYNTGPTPPNQVSVQGTLTVSGSGAVALTGPGDGLTAGTLVIQNPTFSSPNNLFLAGTTLTATKEIDLYGGGLDLYGAVQGLGLINNFTKGASLNLHGQTLSITPMFHQGTLDTGGFLWLKDGTHLTVDGSVNNSGDLLSFGGSGNSLTVTGTLNNSLTFQLQQPGDSATIGTLVNTGFFTVPGSTSVTLTNQPDGVTDVTTGSHLAVYGSFTAGGHSALANLQSVEGTLTVGGNTTLVDTPATGTLTIAPTGLLTQQNPLFTLNGALDNQGTFLVDGVTTIDGAIGNTGLVRVASGATLNVSQNFTTLTAGGELDNYGTVSAGGQAGVLNLEAVNGALAFANGQSQTIAPASGTLNVAGELYVSSGTKVTVQGNLNSSAPPVLFNPVAFQDGEGLTVSVLGTLDVTGTLNNTGYLSGGNIEAAAINNSGSIWFDQNPPIEVGLPTNITVAGTYKQTGMYSQTSLYNPDEIINAATVDIEGGSLTVPQLNAKTLQIGSGASATLSEVNLGGTPSAQSTSPIAQTVIASNGTLIDNGSLNLTGQYQVTVGQNGLTTAGSVTIGAGGALTDSEGDYVQTGGTTLVNGALGAPTVAIDGGTLAGTGTIYGNVTVAGGTIRPGGDPLTINGNFSLSPSSVLLEELSGANTFGALSVSGSASLGGTLDLSLLGNFFPKNLQHFVILDALGGLTGTFASIDGLDFGPGGRDSWNIAYANNEITLTANATVAPVPEPASAGLFATALLALGMIRLPRRRVRGR